MSGGFATVNFHISFAHTFHFFVQSFLKTKCDSKVHRFLIVIATLSGFSPPPRYPVRSQWIAPNGLTKDSFFKKWFHLWVASAQAPKLPEQSFFKKRFHVWDASARAKCSENDPLVRILYREQLWMQGLTHPKENRNDVINSHQPSSFQAHHADEVHQPLLWPETKEASWTEFRWIIKNCLNKKDVLPSLKPHLRAELHVVKDYATRKKHSDFHLWLYFSTFTTENIHPSNSRHVRKWFKKQVSIVGSRSHGSNCPLCYNSPHQCLELLRAKRGSVAEQYVQLHDLLPWRKSEMKTAMQTGNEAELTADEPR